MPGAGFGQLPLPRHHELKAHHKGHEGSQRKGHLQLGMGVPLPGEACKLIFKITQIAFVPFVSFVVKRFSRLRLW